MLALSAFRCASVTWRLGSELSGVRRLTADLDEALVNCRGDLDETLDNILVTSQTLKAFTATVDATPLASDPHQGEKHPVPPFGKVPGREGSRVETRRRRVSIPDDGNAGERPPAATSIRASRRVGVLVPSGFSLP